VRISVADGPAFGPNAHQLTVVRADGDVEQLRQHVLGRRGVAVPLLFFRSHPSLPLTLAALGVVTVGAVLPASPLTTTLGFSPLPAGFFAALAGMVVGYLVLIEIGKKLFYRAVQTPSPGARRNHTHRWIRRRADRFSTPDHLPDRSSEPLMRELPAPLARQGARP
jgi:hypothetical protein